jgi:hypothetical protein
MESYGIDFWQFHGIIFCICMIFFPRLTMLLTGICFNVYFGVLAWIGWLLAPRLTVAILATFFYFPTNPILCVFVWIWAFGGESTEKSTVCKKYGD